MKKIFLFLALTSSMLLAQQEAIIYGLTNSGFLSLRDKAVTGKKIGKLYNDNKVTILATEGKWHKIKLSTSNKIGWAHGNWIKKNQHEKKVDKKKTNVTKVQNHNNSSIEQP